jgi:amino acid transporter
MRFTHGDMPRSFRVPFGPWLIPVIGCLLCILLLINTTKGTAIRFGIWMAVGQIVYFSYAFRHSRARLQERRDSLTDNSEPAPSYESVVKDTSKINLAFEMIDKPTENQVEPSSIVTIANDVVYFRV